MSIEAERVWVMIAIQLAKMQCDIALAKRVGPGQRGRSM
jgi:hypothetical protein